MSDTMVKENSTQEEVKTLQAEVMELRNLTIAHHTLMAEVVKTVQTMDTKLAVLEKHALSVNKILEAKK